MFVEEIEKKISRAVKNWEETNTGDFNDSSFLSYILTLKLLNSIDVTSPADSANINNKLSGIDNSIKTVDANIVSKLNMIHTDLVSVGGKLNMVHTDLVSVEGKLDNIATWLSKVNTGIANSNTLLTQIEANTK